MIPLLSCTAYKKHLNTLLMNRSPLLKPHLSPKQPNRVPTAPLKSRVKAPVNLTDSLGLDRDIFNLAQRIKEHPLKNYSATKEKQKVQVITLPQTASKQTSKRQPIETSDPYQQVLEQKRPQTSKGTRRAKQTDSEYHQQQPEDLVLLNHQITNTQKEPRKKPTTRIIFSAHTKRPKVVHLDQLITKNTSSVRKPMALPFETSIDPEFISLFANRH